MRALRIAGWTAGGLLALLLVLFGLLQTGFGQRQLAAAISDIASSPGQTVRLEGLSGFVPGAMDVARLELADDAGTWLTAEQVTLDWSPLALLRGTLRVKLLRAGNLIIERPPAGAPAEAPPPTPPADGAPLEVPQLPLGLELEALSVERLTLGAGMVGTPLSWKVAGQARLHGLDEDNGITLRADRLDGDGMLDLSARFDGTRQQVETKLLLREGAGGLIGRLAGRPDLPPVEARVDIAGPLGELEGTLAVAGADLLTLDGSMAVRRDGETSTATLSLKGRAGRLADAPWAALVEGPIALDSVAIVDPQAIRLERTTLELTAGRLTLGGRIDREELRRSGPAQKQVFDLPFTLQAAEPRVFEPLLPGIAWSSLKAEGQLAGTPAVPTGSVTLTAEGLAARGVTAGHAVVTAQGGAVAGEPGAYAAALRGEITDVLLPTGGGRNLATSLSLAGAARQGTDGTIEVQSLDIRSPLLEARAAGSGDLRSGRFQGEATGQAPDLAAFAEALGLELKGALDFALKASPSGDSTGLALDATLREGALPGLPPALLAPQLTAVLRGAIGPQEAWTLDRLALASDAATIEASGSGRGESGTVDLSWRFASLAALDPMLAGEASGTAKLSGSVADPAAVVHLVLEKARIGEASVPRLAVDLDAKGTAGTYGGTLAVDGTLQQSPIKGGGQFSASEAGELAVPQFELRWASALIQARDLTVTAAEARGNAAVRIGRLEDLAPFIGTPLGGSVDATLQASAGNRLALRATAQRLTMEDQLAIDEARLDGEITDPLGKGTLRATLNARGSKLAGPLTQLTARASGDLKSIALNADASGDKTRVALQARVAPGPETVIDLQRLEATQAGENVSLAAPAKIRLRGETVAIDRLRLTAAGGSLQASGMVDPSQSNLQVQGRSLPLRLLALADPTLRASGTLDLDARLRGALARPDAEVTFNARDMRLRTVEASGLPPATLQGRAGLRADTLTLDARLTAGRNNNLAVDGRIPLPKGGPVSNGNLNVKGDIDMAAFTPLLGGSGRLRGRLGADLALTAQGGTIGGQGSVTMRGGRYLNTAQGLAIGRGQATIDVEGDRLVIREFTARTRGRGELALSGGLRLDPELTIPVDVRLVARDARVLDRKDMMAVLSADLRLAGTVAQGLELRGEATVQRAEINIGGSQGGPQIADLPVREINRPGIEDDKPAGPAAPEAPIALAMKIRAPQAVFVRGRGLDAEVGGDLDVGGTVARPQIGGGLQLRRGTFDLFGQQLKFTSGSVTFPDPDRLDPLLDFNATTRIEAGEVQAHIGGRPSAPLVTLSSQPEMPQDELMAQLLFGKAANTLSPLQLAQIGQSVAELSGMTGSGGGLFDRLRKAFGFDRLSVGSDDTAAASDSALAGASLELGRYIAPGIYLGAKQGAEAGSSRAIVNIELTPSIKVETEVGADARSRFGVNMEWDY